MLHDNFAGLKLRDIEFISGKYEKNGPPDGYTELKQNKLHIIEVLCHGKMIYFVLSKDKLPHESSEYSYIISNLGLDGSWSPDEYKDRNNFRLIFNKNKSAYYRDPIGFGTLRIIHGNENFDKILQKLGPDPIINDYTYDEFIGMITKKKNINKMIAEIFEDQSNLSGIGNYLRAEILYSSKVRPDRICKTLTEDELKKIHKYSVKKIRKSYNHSGTKRYNGHGEFKLNVYGRKIDPKGNEVLIMKIKKRSLHWVREIQI